MDFAVLDARGDEEQALIGLHLERIRPRIIVAARTQQLWQADAQSGFETLLATHDYLFASTDGVNRYYVRGEDRDELLGRLAPGELDRRLRDRQ